METPLVIEPDRQSKYAVIWMHGLGADKSDFVSVLQELRLPANHAIRFLFPQADSIPVTVNAKMVMPAWYDILDMSSLERHIDYEGMKASCKDIVQLMQQQFADGIAWKNMVLAGFSQGGVIAYASTLMCEHRIGGMMLLSSYSPYKEKQIFNHPCSAFVGHGKHDPVVPFALAENCVKQLGESGVDVTFHTYPMEHSVCQQEIAHIRQWLVSTLRFCSQDN